MSSFNIFILGCLGIFTLIVISQRYFRYRIIKLLLDENKTSEDIKKVMTAYRGEN